MGAWSWKKIPLAAPTVSARRRIPAWLARAAGTAVALAALAVTATACGTSTPAFSGPASPTAPASGGGGGGGATTSPLSAPTSSAAPAGGGATASAAPATARNACSIPVVLAIAGESSSADAARTASWVTLQANDWTVFVPNSDWHLSASTAGGADIFSPDGNSAANLGDKESQTPWTLATLSQVALSSVSNLNIICMSSIERSSSLTSQATEFTGDYQGMHIHGVVVLSLLTPTTPNFFVGEIRSIYTPAAQWSTAAEQTLWLIVKHAVFVPQQP